GGETRKVRDQEADFVRLWEVRSGKELPVLTGFDKEIVGLLFTPDGDLVTVGGEGAVRFWGLDTDRESRPAWQAAGPLFCAASSPALEGHAAPVLALGFTPDGKRILSSTLDDEFRTWDPRTGKPGPPSRGGWKRLETLWLAAAARTSALLCENGMSSEWDDLT